MAENKKILVCPLNWGLGHASRMIPVIQLLIDSKLEVIVAASGNSLAYLKNEFPHIQTSDFKSYSVKYSKHNSQLWKMIGLTPKIIFWTLKEHFVLKKIIKRNKIDVVLSDNRFGLWNRKVYSVFITHQLRVKFPNKLQVFEFFYQRLLKLVIKQYNELWIPDYGERKNLAGDLSHINIGIDNCFYIGPLSRFNLENKKTSNSNIDVLFVLSGPEPQRSIFEKIICDQISNYSGKCILVRGTNDNAKNNIPVEYYNVLNTKDLSQLIIDSKVIICRSGYSSIMDLITINRKAVLVPTPGQTEQEYLAEYLMNQGLFYYMNQNEFSINQAINRCFDSPNLEVIGDQKVLKERINFLKRYNNYRNYQP